LTKHAFLGAVRDRLGAKEMRFVAFLAALKRK
jgi:hypothetical protein